MAGIRAGTRDGVVETLSELSWRNRREDQSQWGCIFCCIWSVILSRCFDIGLWTLGVESTTRVHLQEWARITGAHWPRLASGPCRVPAERLADATSRERHVPAEEWSMKDDGIGAL